MERKISISDLRKAVDEAYEAFKSLKEGEVNPRNVGADDKKFGITVALPDGTIINKADTDYQVPMGSIAKVPLSTILFTQNKPYELVKKSGQGCCCKSSCQPKNLPFSAHGVRAFSAVEPTGDPESKWNLFENRAIDLMGSAPLLDVAVLEKLTAEAAEAKMEDTLAADGYYLYDDASLAIKLYLKALSMKASSEQLARMGATIAADGVNPWTKKIVFDGAITQNVVGLMAAKGPHKMLTPWMVLAGVPAKSSFGGSFLAIYPGVMAIAAVSPALNEAGIGIKAARSVAEILGKLDISMFASARPVFVND